MQLHGASEATDDIEYKVTTFLYYITEVGVIWEAIWKYTGVISSFIPSYSQVPLFWDNYSSSDDHLLDKYFQGILWMWNIKYQLSLHHLYHMISVCSHFF